VKHDTALDEIIKLNAVLSSPVKAANHDLTESRRQTEKASLKMAKHLMLNKLMHI